MCTQGRNQYGFLNMCLHYIQKIGQRLHIKEVYLQFQKAEF